MIANNIFKAIGDFFTDVLFPPLHGLKGLDDWWVSNIINFGFVVVFLVLLGYWMKESLRFKKEGTEDLPK
jgi:hypothetical protein